MSKIKNKFNCFWGSYFAPYLSAPILFLRWVLPYHHKKETERVTVDVNNRGYRWVVHNYIGDLFMFVQDMHQGIMPFTHIRTDRPQFISRIEPENEDLEILIANSLDHRGYRHHLSDAISDFIRNTTHSLFIYGRVVYEIVYETDANGNITRFEFVNINPLSVKRFLGKFFQVIPWRIAKYSNVRTGIRKIPKHKILYIEFPKSLGGIKNLKKVLRRLDILSKNLIPKFHMNAMEKSQNIGFDLNQYVYEKYIEKGQLTKQFGWHQRKIPDNEILEYYLIYRHLNFVLSQALIREHILSKINEALNGPLLNLGVKIIMENVLTSDQIKAEFGVLKRGNFEFTNLFKRTTQI